jgi:integral membrane protein (TIGR01906 family)
MMKKIKASPAFDIVGLGSVIVFILMGALMIVLQARFFYRWEIGWNKLTQIVFLTPKTIQYNYDVVVNYISAPWISKLEMPNFAASASGLQHFSDVKKLVVLAEVLFVLSIVPTVIYLRDIKTFKAWFKFLNPMRIMIALPIVLGLLLSIGFDQFFVAFHKLLFTNDTWIFDPHTDPVINILPENFFMHCFILYFVLIELAFVALSLKGKLSLKKR